MTTINEYIAGIYDVDGNITPLEFDNLDSKGAFKAVKKALNGARIGMATSLYDIGNYDLFVDEEGLYKNLACNPFFPKLVGNVVLLPIKDED